MRLYISQIFTYSHIYLSLFFLCNFTLDFLWIMSFFMFWAFCPFAFIFSCLCLRQVTYLLYISLAPTQEILQLYRVRGRQAIMIRW